jgi:VRR-NUC domain
VTGPARRLLDLEISETAYRNTIVAAARLHGWLVHHCRPAQDRRGQWATHIQGDPGFPDLILVRGGRMLCLEVKAEKGKATAAQEAWIGAMRRVPGAVAEVVRPSTWSWVQAQLTRTEPRAFGHDP